MYAKAAEIFQLQIPLAEKVKTKNDGRLIYAYANVKVADKRRIKD